MPNSANEVLTRLQQFQYVDDTELEVLQDKFLKLREMLQDFSPRYDLALWDVNRKTDELESMISERKRFLRESLPSKSS
jgi:hypothetical protein